MKLTSVPQSQFKILKKTADVQKFKEPEVIISLKFYHLVLREKDLYTGIEDFLHFFPGAPPRLTLNEYWLRPR